MPSPISRIGRALVDETASDPLPASLGGASPVAPAPDAPASDTAPPDAATHAGSAGGPDFTPVTPAQPRSTGWTVEKQRGFIEALLSTGSVAQACRAVGMSRQSAYKLRFARGGESFAGAWDAALSLAGKMLADIAFEIAVEGEEVPHYWKGELVGTHVRRDKAMLKWLIARLDKKKFGKFADVKYMHDPDQHEVATQALKRNLTALKAPGDDAAG